MQDQKLRIHLFDTSTSPPLVIACTCGHSPCVAKNRLAEFSHPTANPSARQPLANNLGYAQPTAYAVQAPLPYSYPTMSAPVSPQMAPAYSMQSMQPSGVSMATMRTGASITPEMMAANRAPYVYAQHMAPQHVVNPNQVPRHSQGPIYVSSSTGTHVNVSQGAIKTEVRDPTAIRAACTRLHLAEPVSGTTRLFSTSATGLIVQFPAWRYPVVCETETGQIHYDNFENHWGDRAVLDQFLQAYAVENSGRSQCTSINGCLERIRSCPVSLSAA